MFRRVAVLAVCFVSALLHAQTLHGVGSTAQYPLFEDWIKSYKKSNPGVKLHFTPTGSNRGIEEFLEGRTDFVATDIMPAGAQLQTAKQRLGGDILQVPMALDAVVPIYSVDGVNTELKFTAAALAGIYLGKITRWDDPEIADANPGVSLPSETIKVVHRSDDNDTTYLWTEYLSRVSPEWKAGPGAGLNVNWPVGLGAKGDDGVEDLVIGPKVTYDVDDFPKALSNSIGYIQLHYAIERNLPYGDVENASGAIVRAAPSSIMAEAASATESMPNAYRGLLTDVASPTGYPIASFTWILVPANMQDKAKTKAMAGFLKWMLNEGQYSVVMQHYVKLPPAIIESAAAEVAKLR
ncbi:MAG: phosphate ABC transporter substrate-binding protein PstS [Silvibacterium sp.]|nr:phosphate ABC transporter substrate-binding protein PstS [Silvibacterium sp.]MBV8438702.1 phosphate ABC transporter substrate-binding protein PstS [Silvibacterium sp.]